MSFDDPNEILARYTIRETKNERRINPDNVPEFSNKVTYGNGITVYTVDDTQDGQLAVRSIIDTHWGEDANPWCLAARTENLNFNEDEYEDEYEYEREPDLTQAWDYWSNTYNAVDKRIAFQNGKLLAFCASDNDINTWWDREDHAHEGIPYTVKENGNTFVYSYNETTGQSIKIKETLSDETIRTWSDNGTLKSETLSDGTQRDWYDNGLLKSETLSNRTRREWSDGTIFEGFETMPDSILRGHHKQGKIEQRPDGQKHGQLLFEHLPDNTEHRWNDKGQLLNEKLPDGTEHRWYNNGHLWSEKLPNERVTREWYENDKIEQREDGIIHGQLKSEISYDGTGRTWYESGRLHTEQLRDRKSLLGWIIREWYDNDNKNPKKEFLPNGTKREWFENGNQKSEEIPYKHYRYWFENGYLSSEKLNDGTERAWYESGKLKSETIPDRHKNYTIREWYENGQIEQREDGEIHGQLKYEIIPYEPERYWDVEGNPTDEAGNLIPNDTSNGEVYSQATTQEAVDYFNNYKRKHPDQFITPDALAQMERYDQLVTHATGNIIWNNRFDLRFAGSGEGHAAFGFGAYFEQNPEVAKSYRGMGLSWRDSANDVIITLKNGKSLSLWDRNIWRNDYPYTALAIYQFKLFFDNNPNATAQEALSAVKDDYKALIEKSKRSKNDRDMLEDLRKQLHAVNSITDVSFTKGKRGNIYQFDIPEDYELLDWDADLDEQPEQIKKSIRKLINALSRKGYSRNELSLLSPHIGELDTGESLYWAVEHVFEKSDNLGQDMFGLKRKGITRSDARASWLFNRYGIPGHRYWDGMSRDEGEGTHNFVIWNMGRVTMTGISDDSDEFARKTFYNGGKQQLSLFDNDGNPAETYQQIIGTQGAQAIDRRHNNTWLMDNLDVAKVMTKAGEKPLKIRLATGWELGTDGEWKYEIQDGNINITRDLRKILHGKGIKLPYSIKLKHLYNNAELFTAYPQLNDLRVEIVDDLPSGIFGFFEYHDDPAKRYIALSSAIPLHDLQSALIHEIQHAVQSIEGFAEGGEDRNVIISGQAARAIAVQQIKSLLPNASKELIRAAELYRKGAINMADNIVRSLSKLERKIWNNIKPEIDFMRKGHIRLFSTSFYQHLGGEVEARNVQAREHFTPEQRRHTLFSDTQDENNWLISKNGVEQNFTVEQDYDYDTNSAASYSFLTPEQLERYNQLVYHGTNNTILGNRFDLRFLGSSEGSASRGYGAYFAENLDVARTYRHYGDEYKGDFRISITTNNGKTYKSLGLGRWNIGVNAYWSSVLDDLRSHAVNSNIHDIEKLKKDILKSYKQELKEHRSILSELKRELKNNPRNDTQDRINLRSDYINNVKEKIKALNSVTGITVLPPKNGNIYSFDIPENDVLLDWDKTMGRQPEKIKRARKFIIDEIRRWGLDNSEVKKAKTGEDFYRALTHLFIHSWDYGFAYPQSGIKDPQQRASLILNMHGVPGLRFLDSGSRDKKRGTHNFVIWNADTIEMLGIMPDSNPEAIEHFNNTAKQQETSNPNETYNQFIGEEGINNLALDGRFSAIGTHDTLDKAKELDAKHMPASFIWKSTGWIKGKDGKWRTEIPDGDVYDTFLNNPKRRTVELQDVYDNDILYAAYPNSRHIYVKVQKLDERAGANYNPRTKTITLNQLLLQRGEFDIVRSDFIHEIQHAIQVIEDWDLTSPIHSDLIKKINNIDNRISRLINSQPHATASKLIDAEIAFNDDNQELVNNIVNSMNSNERKVWDKISNLYEKRQQIVEPYLHSASEVEARNAQTRADWDMDKRRNTPPTLSEDTPRSKQILNGDNNTSSGSFLTPEKYDQLIHHGTRHILLGNRFDLRYLNMGEGRQFYGYGIYLSENSDVAEYYKKVGMSDDEIEVRDGNHYLVDGPENDTLLDWDATLSEQPKQILDILKKSGWLEEVYGDDYLELPDYVLNLSGERFYKDLGSYLNDEIWRRYHRKEDPYMLASMKLNELGIPGLRYFDSWSRDKKSNTHNFVIWNTDTLRLLGLTNDSEQDAHDYYSAEDYSSAYLDSRDNDSDVVDYSDRDYDYDMAHFDDIAEAHSDALDDNGFNETYKQSANDNSMDTNNTVRSVYDFLTPEAKRQVAIIRAKYHGTPQWLKAPNGEDTNLTELQWLLVRTPNFKRWFGDWELNTDNASKIVDNNGEPRIVYHGSPEEEFSVFKTGGGNSKTENTGAWFTSNIQAAKTYFNDFEENSLYPVFLNIRNPYIYNAGGRFWDELGTISIINRNDNTTITADKNGNPFSSIQKAEDYIRHHFNGNERNYYAEVSNPTTTDKIVREIKSQNENYDGIIFKDILDTGEGQNSDEDFYNEFSFEDDFIGDDFVVFLPNNIKSATRNNGEYSLSNDEIYKQSIGETGARAIDKTNGNTNLMDKFRLAQQMKQRGIKPRTIKRSTGWELGIEGKWRYDLQDGVLRNPDAKKFMPLSEFYDNPELFKAYPKLNNINVAFDMEYELFTPAVFNPTPIGRYDRKNHIIHLQSMFRRYFSYLPYLPKNDYRHDEVKEIKAWLVSQIQRLIQPVEGFSPSRTPGWFAWKPRTVHKLDDNGNLYPTIVDRFPAASHEHTAGETEARNAGKRADFSQEQRRNTLLADTEDINRNEQLVIQRDNITNSADNEANALLDAGNSDGFNETYQQIFGRKGIHALARKNDNFNIVKNLYIAERMDEAGKTPNEIKLATGWEKAPDGEWRYEIMDGTLIPETLQAVQNGKNAMRLGGEIEARNTEARADLTPEQRRNTLLADTQDSSDWIIRDRYGNISVNNEQYNQTARNSNLDNNTVRTVDDFLTPEARRQVNALRIKYQGTAQWLKAPNGKSTNLNELQWLLVRTNNFKRWFGDWEFNPAMASKVVDENGEPLVVYHGTGRADRVGSIFRKDRATSGPMAFFTDSRNMAEGYSKNKADTSLSREDLRDYRNQFVIVKKGRNGKETYITLPDYWYMLPMSKRQQIAAIAPTITIDEDTYDDDDWYKIISKPDNSRGMGGYELHIREQRGNHLAALIEEWLNSANLFGKEKKFIDVLHLIGLDNVTYRDPKYRQEAVYAVFMNMRNPLNTSNIPETVVKALKRSAVAAQRHFDPANAYNSDAWDKTNISPNEWIEQLDDNIQSGTTYVWTTIPDFVTNRLKKLGYDGIKDTGGKYHKEKHNVYIPFEPIQVKSSEKNNGEYSLHNQEIYKQTATNNNEQPFYGIDADGRQLMLRFNQPEIDALYEKHKKNGTLFRAPNGKKSNLPQRAWLLVRTPAFKNWFGDWENNPQNASKVIDENGEPLIVLHQTTYGNGFSTFDTHGYEKTKGTGAWFADLKGQKPYLIDEEGVYVYRVFLNIRNPYVYNAQGKRWAELGTVWIADETGGSPIYYDKNDKPFVNKTHALDYIIHELHEEAILTTDDMGRKFYKPRYRVQYKESSYPTTDHLVRAVRRGKLGNGYNDGVIIRNVNDLGYFEPIDDYVIFKPIQVKSKDNNGAFNNNNTEIYKQSASDRDMDGRYFDALNAGDMDTARSIVDEQARRKGYSTDNEHRGQHQPATSQDGFPNLANIMNSDLVPADYWTHPQYYLYSPEEWDAYYAVTHAIRNKKPLTVYRAVPDDVKETALRNGDWVTPSRDYAIQHGQSSLDGKYRIISAKVGLNRLWWDGNSIAELGYDDGKNYVYRNTKNGRKLNDTVVHGWTGTKFKEDEHGHLLRDENGHLIVEKESRDFIVPPSKRFNYRKSEEYFQTANNTSNNSTRTVKSFLSLEAKKQVEAIRAKFYGTNLWLKAPNGEQSNLDELQWLLIRTPNFKQWFGDWENNPQDASKVLDDNGEPLIVYHAPAFYPDFSIFNVSNSGASKNTGSWFNSNKKVALTYNVPRDENYLYAVFLNIRNPFILDVKGRNWDDLADVNNMGYKTTNEIIRGVWNGDFGYPDNTYYDGVILKNIKDNAGNADFIGDDYIVPYSEQIKSATRNNGNYDSTSGWRNDIYKQSANIENNPLVETYRQVNPFSNPMSEAIYRRGQQPEKPKSAWQSIKQYLREIRKGFRGDFPLLAGQEAKDKGLTAAREILRIMNRNTDAKSHMVIVSLYDSLHGLNSEQFDIFSRLMLLNDIRTFAINNPTAREHLPLGYNAKSLVLDYNKFLALAKKDKAIIRAIQTELNNNKNARQDLINLANKLGFRSLAKRLQDNDLFLVQYANLLGNGNINTNYITAIGEMRITMLQDFEHLLAVKKLKDKGYDKKAELIRKFGDDWKRHLPKGYSIFNPLSGYFIQSAHALTENVIGMALKEAGQQLGLSDKTMSALRAKISDKFGTQLMVLPDEITQTLTKLSTPNQHDPLYKFAKKLTNGWKKYVLYFPTRVWKYNLRNITGDLDAALAGDPTMIRFFPQAFSELTTAFYGNKTKISSELKEFQARGGALTFRSAQDLLEDRQSKEASKLIADLDAKGNSAWKNLPRNAWKLLDKFLGKLSDYREQWIRYAVYLDYLHQMQQNNGIPNNWGASDKDEVMSIDDIRDRAFKMANELIGAYDQISESGRALRDLLIPFYSWMEVNAKRYWQLLKNGLTEEEIGDFAQRFLKGQIANIPYYTYKVGKTLLFISLFSILVQAFNNFFWPEDEEKLPPEIRERPHLVFGHDKDGNVLYFTQVGALFDVLDWFGLDTFRHDVKQIFNGQQTVTGWLKHISSAPFIKLINGITPLIKTPFELGSGYSYFPDITHPRMINDNMQYLAQSFGLTWPLKFAKRLFNGYSYSNWQEFRNLFIYAQDAEQAAYFYTLNLVNQFRENVLGEKFSGYSTNKRTQALRDFKTALRFDDKKAAVRSLHDYYSLDGTDNGLKTSMRNMHPLHSLNSKNKDRFLKWISEEDRAFIQRAEAYYKKQLKRYDDALKEYNAPKSNSRRDCTMKCVMRKKYRR